ncbi:MAG: hypothetical protein ACXVLQ_13010 [Bacteriovorax sp.]
MGRRNSEDVRKSVGLLLAKKGLMDPKIAAMELEVSERTLRTWKKCAKEGAFKKIGRPKKLNPIEKLKMIKLVLQEYKLQGRPGWRPVAAGLRGRVPTRVVQETLSKIKLKERRDQLQMKKWKMKSVKVNYPNVIWTQDGTHLGRLRNKKEVQAQVIKDRCTLKIKRADIGPAANSEKIIETLKTERASELPLVWMTDNGACYTSKDVMQFLDESKVIHLKNFPHTPEHNGACERAIRELKEVSRLGKGIVLQDEVEATEKLKSAAATLDNFRRHASLGYMTSKDREKHALKIDVGLIRDEMYNRYKSELKKIEMNMHGRSKRHAEREMIFCLLEEYGLITRSTGVRIVERKSEEVFL